MRGRAWHVLTDLDNATTLIPSITSVERLTDGPYAAGTRWRETRTMLGRTETHELEVAEAAEPERTAVTALTGGVHYTTTMHLDPDPAGTKLTITFGADQPNATLGQRVMWTVMGPIGSVFTRKVLDKELQEIRDAAIRAQPIQGFDSPLKRWHNLLTESRVVWAYSLCESGRIARRLCHGSNGTGL